MNLGSYQKIKLNDFRGLYDRGDREIAPLSHFSDCLNVDYELGKFKTRSGTSLYYTPSSGTIRRNFAQINLADQGIFYVLSIDFSGNIYLETVPPNPPTTTFLANVVGSNAGNNFSIVQYFNHLFICVYNGIEGVDNLYIFNPLPTPGASMFRLAGGLKPATMI